MDVIKTKVVLDPALQKPKPQTIGEITDEATRIAVSVKSDRLCVLLAEILLELRNKGA